jgi:hypothetical protein
MHNEKTKIGRFLSNSIYTECIDLFIERNIQNKKWICKNLKHSISDSVKYKRNGKTMSKANTFSKENHESIFLSNTTGGYILEKKKRK